MYQDLLVGTDGSSTAARAVDRAVDLAQTHGARLTIFSAGGRLAIRAVEAEAERHASAGVEITTRTAPGEASVALLEEAARGRYDLLVVGNKGLTGLRRLSPAGSVPAHVSHHLACSLLVVRTT